MSTRSLVAEFLGTFFLCFAGIAAIVSTGAPVHSGVGLVGIALAHGLALSVAVNAFGGISGAHFNPAVTLGFLSTGRIGAASAIAYIVTQCVGASVAAAACLYIFPAEAVSGARLGIPLPAPWATAGVVLLAEFIMTYLLMTAIYGTAVDNRGRVVKIGGFGVGLTLAFCILAGGQVSGASLNPARSFGPALVYEFWEWHWTYWIAPVAGAILAALVYEHVLLEKAPGTGVSPRDDEVVPAWASDRTPTAPPK
jgi:MIP family channel proteins